MSFFRQCLEQLKHLSRVEHFTLLATVIGLAADVIALLTFVDLIALPPESSAAGGLHETFLVWVGIATVYSLALVTSFLNRRVHRRYKRLLFPTGRYLTEQENEGAKSDYGEFLRISFPRRYMLAALPSFPCLYAYMLAVVGVLSPMSDVSPWHTLLITAGLGAMVVVPIITLTSYAIDFLIMAVNG